MWFWCRKQRLLTTAVVSGGRGSFGALTSMAFTHRACVGNCGLYFSERKHAATGTSSAHRTPPEPPQNVSFGLPGGIKNHTVLVQPQRQPLSSFRRSGHQTRCPEPEHHRNPFPRVAPAVVVGSGSATLEGQVESRCFTDMHAAARGSYCTSGDLFRRLTSISASIASSIWICSAF